MGGSLSKKHKEPPGDKQAVIDPQSGLRHGTPIAGRYHQKDISTHYNVETKVLGSGYSGPVKFAVHKVTKRHHAVKTFLKKGKSPEKLDMFRNEVEIFLRLDHPYICFLSDVYETHQYIHMVMELCSGGELYDRLHQAKIYDEPLARSNAQNMLLAINYLHAHGIVHRDLKLENFLYEDRSPEAKLKLIDFGFSKVWDPKTRMQASCGSISYVAPDVLKGSYTNKCDLWSFGVIVFMLLSGYPPFWGTDNQMFARIKAGRYTMREDRWKCISKEGTDFVKQLLQVKPENRMSAAAALRHDWMKMSFDSPCRLDKNVADALKNYAEASHFQRAMLTMMAWHMNADDRQNLSEIFLQMDKNKEGTIKASDFASVLHEHYDIDTVEAQQLFERMDNNHDERINYSEFLAAITTTRLDLHEDLLRCTFDRFDSEKTGFISNSDMRKALGDDFDDQTWDEIVASVDINKDGMISYEEFLTEMRNLTCKNAQTTRAIDASFSQHVGDTIGESTPMRTKQRRASQAIKNVDRFGAGET